MRSGKGHGPVGPGQHFKTGVRDMGTKGLVFCEWLGDMMWGWGCVQNNH